MGQYTQMVWSPDGTKIAYTTQNDDYTLSLFVVDADGTNTTKITDSTGWFGSWVWLPA